MSTVLAAAFNGAVSAAAPMNDPNGSEPLQILYHEPLPSLDAQGSQDLPSGDGQPVSFAFDAFGRSFHLILEPNDGLIEALPSAQKQRLKAQMRLYRGHLSGIEDSWVRLTQVGGKFSGAIYDGMELYLIDGSEELAGALAMAAETSPPYTVIYRLSDVIGGEQCALEPYAQPLSDYQSLVQELQDQVQALPAASRQLSLVAVGDTQFAQSNRADPEAAVTARMNVADGIFSGQVGVHLQVAGIRILQNDGDLTSNSAQTLLSQFSSYTNSSGFNNPGLAHLFTGRRLQGYIGYAYIGTLCSRTRGMAVSSGSSASYGGLVATHEIGHNFGAYHDNQSGSPCASTPSGFIMNPSISGSSRQFSTCSMQYIQRQVSSARCITPISDPPNTPTADVRPALPTNPINANVGQSFTYRIEVSNGGRAVAMNAGATITLPTALQVQGVNTDAGTCSNTAGRVSCGLGDLAAGGTRTLTLTLMGQTVGSFTSTVTVSADNDGNPANNTLQAAINLGSINTGSSLFEAHFDAGKEGFRYADDTFRNTKQPRYVSGTWSRTQGFSGGGLVVTLGGRDNREVGNMSGGWSRAFTLSEPRRLVLTFRYRLSQTPYYESDELSQALLSVDGHLIGAAANQDYLAQLQGDDNGGSEVTTDWQPASIDLGELGAGSHTLVIGAFNNQKTYANERTQLTIDDVVLTVAP
jgi:uncharacterized repeat protein (TIGR01451 family)